MLTRALSPTSSLCVQALASEDFCAGPKLSATYPLAPNHPIVSAGLSSAISAPSVMDGSLSWTVVPSSLAVYSVKGFDAVAAVGSHWKLASSDVRGIAVGAARTSWMMRFVVFARRVILLVVRSFTRGRSITCEMIAAGCSVSDGAQME